MSTNWGKLRDWEDAYDLTYNNVISPVSNPRTTNSASLNFSMEVKGTTILQFYFTNPYAGKPSKPQNLQVGPSANNHPKLTWTANSESDLLSYKIYKKVMSELGWQYLATTTSTNYEDLTEEYLTGGQQAYEHNVYYRITLMDTQSLESLPSEQVTARVAGAPLEKKGFGEEADSKPITFALFQNYPNPFNPSTVINYQLPERNFVNIKVYNMLGEIVAVMENQFKEAGSYSLQFDGSKLSSGTYLYTIQAGEYFESRKMLLIK